MRWMETPLLPVSPRPRGPWLFELVASRCSSLPAKHVARGGVRHGAAGTGRRMARGACSGLGGSEGRAAKAWRQYESGGFESSFRHRPVPRRCPNRTDVVSNRADVDCSVH